MELITLVAGNSLRLNVTVVSSTGNVVDLTDVTEIFWASTVPRGSTQIIKSLSNNEIAIVNALAGTLTVDISRSDFTQPGSYDHEIQLEFDGAARYTVGQGTLRVVPSLLVGV